MAWVNRGSLKGPQGPQGPQGDTGATGAAAGFGTVSATVDSGTGTPSVNVSTSGSDTAKSITFAFHNLKGATGSPGSDAQVKKNAVMIGNSYVTGVANSNRGFEYYLDDYFDNLYTFCSDTAGFMDNTVATQNFGELLSTANSSPLFTNTDITHVFFMSAIGDTYNMDANISTSTYTSSVETVLGNAHTYFPNADIYICYCECVGTLQSRDSFSQSHYSNQYKLHNLFKNMRGAIYMGWIGWNINLIPDLITSDGTHPNDDGYDYLVTAFKRALNGNNPYMHRNGDAAISDTLFQITVNASNPDSFNIKVGQTRPTNFGTLTSGSVKQMAVFPSTLPVPSHVSGRSLPIKYDVNQASWFQITVARSGNSMYLMMNPTTTQEANALGTFWYFDSVIDWDTTGFPTNQL